LADRRAPLRRLRPEQLAALAVCTIAALIISWRILRADVFTQDAFVHQYWMWSFRDPQLFNDGLTAELRDSARYPVGYQALFWLGAQLTSPILFGELLGVALMALSGWLVFLIVREHSAWRPAAWIAAALFLALIDIHRFHGGLQRAFVHPVVLLTVLLALRRKDLAAALVAAAGALVYPPAALLAVGALGVSALARDGLRPLLERRRAAYAGLAVALAAAFVLAPTLSDAAPRVMSADEARRFAEFGPDGGLHFFVPSVVEYLTQNRSGFDLRATGSILLVAAVAALAAQRGNVRLIRREVLALPVVALGAFALAQAVLFRLYLPHRYTYPLVAFFAIAVAVSLAPTWDALWARPRRRLLAFAALCAPAALYVVAVYAFPLGPTEPLERLASWTAAAIAGAVVAAAAAVAVLLGRAARAPAAGALVTGLALVGTLLIADHSARGSACARRAATPYLAQLPKDAVIAGDPNDLECLPATARRAVVISTQLAPSYEAEYFLAGRARMFATLRAYYGRSAAAIADLHARYGATHLWVRRSALQAEMTPAGRRWPERRLPYGPYVRELLRGGEPATLRLPASCRRWARGAEEVYDIRCIRARQSARSAIDARADSTNRITRSPASSTSEA
jgi:hypothetical protein